MGFLDSIEASDQSMIISTNALMVREGVDLKKGMNYRDGEECLSVFLVLMYDGEYHDVWHEDTQLFEFRGHDSNTAESDKTTDQLMQYGSGRLTDNGKFYKAAQEYKDGLHKEALQIQIYEKLDSGAWFDKGIFNLIDAIYEKDESGRKIFRFYLDPVGKSLEQNESSLSWNERMIPTGIKSEVWQRDNGRCIVCGAQVDLHFFNTNTNTHSYELSSIQLRCGEHSGLEKRGLL